MKFFKNAVLCAALLPVMYLPVHARDVTAQGLAWYSYFNTLKINDKWQIISEIHERHFLNSVAQHQNVYRFKAHYTLGKSGWDIAPSMTFFLQTTPQDPERMEALMVPELRPHLELNYKQKLSRAVLMHRYRLEARFFHNVNDEQTALEPGYSFGNFRARYQFSATVPLFKIKDERKLSLRLGDELMVNFGKKIEKNFFDQNRIFGSVVVDVLDNLSLDAGYLNWYQQRPNGTFYNRHFLRIGVQHTIRLKKAR